VRVLMAESWYWQVLEHDGEAIMAYLRDTGEYPAGGRAPL
jgi:hypothetical protein